MPELVLTLNYRIDMICVKPFHELLKMRFIIPPYQRGYRWDKEQVEALLNDLQEFIKNNVKKKLSGVRTGTYYCLQPVVVVPSVADNGYIVVDGQQRLTTVYLILHYLRNEQEWNFPIFPLSMPSREVEGEYLSDKKFKNPACEEEAGNIDVFYIRQAYDAIARWFATDPSRAQNKDYFRRLFAYVPEEDEENRDVRVIWYEISDMSALDAFRRLNYGKIPLTSAELVKALLLKGKVGSDAGEYRRGAAYRRALEWDLMEQTLQNPYLWSMLADPSESPVSHFDVVLDFVADELNDEMRDSATGKRPFVRKGRMFLLNCDSCDYFNYNVVNEYLSRNKDAVDTVWNRIRGTFNLMSNWYDNTVWYHLIGLLRILVPKSKRKSRREFVKDIYYMSVGKDGKAVDRPLFTELLRKRISDMIELPEGVKELKDLSYAEGRHRSVIVQILELLNVREAMEDVVGGRFAFYLFDKFNETSLEHIHPQNITTEVPYDDFVEWVERRGKDFEEICRNDSEEQKMQHRAAADALLKLRSVKQGEYTMDSCKAELNEAVLVLDRFFGDLSGITESELHSISNLALVDQPTNSALQNYFLDRKRDILLNRHSHNETYALPATLKVFSKEYSRASPGDMRLWRKEDRGNYLTVILDTYNYFKGL